MMYAIDNDKHILDTGLGTETKGVFLISVFWVKNVKLEIEGELRNAYKLSVRFKQKIIRNNF